MLNVIRPRTVRGVLAAQQNLHMESFKLELHPDKGSVHVALFKDVKNASDLRQRLLSQDTTLSVALVNASLV